MLTTMIAITRSFLYCIFSGWHDNRWYWQDSSRSLCSSQSVPLPSELQGLSQVSVHVSQQRSLSRDSWRQALARWRYRQRGYHCKYFFSEVGRKEVGVSLIWGISITLLKKYSLLSLVNTYRNVSKYQKHENGHLKKKCRAKYCWCF